MSLVMPPSATAPLTLPGVPWLAVVPHGDSATVTVGSVAVDVALIEPADGGPVAVEVAPEGVTLAQLAGAGGTDPLSALPPTLAARLGGVAISHLRVSVDVAEHSLAGASIEVSATEPWEIVAGRLAVRDLDVTLAIDAQRALTGSARGALHIGSVDVPVGWAGRRPRTRGR